MGIRIIQKGNLVKTTTFLTNVSDWSKFRKTLDKFGEMGCDALKENTPRDSGVTADSWEYFVDINKAGASIKWVNNSFTEIGHIPIVILLQYGHGTRNGGFVQGRDFINPAMEPVFDYIVSWLDHHLKD